MRARRHAEQVAAGRERDPRRLARDREGGRRGGRGLALPLPRRRRRARPAGADDERDQRRRPRGQHDRPPGVHGRPGRRVELRRGDADRDGGLPLAEVGAPRAWPVHGCRGRGRLRAGSRLQRGGDRGDPRGRRAGRPPRAGGDCARPGLDRVLQRRCLPLRGPRGRRRRDGRFLRRSRRALPARLRSRTAWPRTTGARGGR